MRLACQDPANPDFTILTVRRPYGFFIHYNSILARPSPRPAMEASSGRDETRSESPTRDALRQIQGQLTSAKQEELIVLEGLGGETSLGVLEALECPINRLDRYCHK